MIDSHFQDIVCPICRVTISYDEVLAKSQPEGTISKDDIPPLNADIRQMQAKMAKLFQQQKAKGGIIDLEMEKNKYLVTPVSLSLNLIAFAYCSMGE